MCNHYAVSIEVPEDSAEVLLSVAGVVSLLVHVVVFEHLFAVVESLSAVVQWSCADVAP